MFFYRKYQAKMKKKMVGVAFLSAIFSGVVGFFVSHFFNPKSGDQNRKDLEKKTTEFKKYSSKLAEDLQKRGEEVKKNLQEVSGKLVEKTKKKDDEIVVIPVEKEEK